MLHLVGVKRGRGDAPVGGGEEGGSASVGGGK